MTNHEKYAAAQRALQRRGFARQADWPELVQAVVAIAEEIAARMMIEEQDYVG